MPDQRGETTAHAAARPSRETVAPKPADRWTVTPDPAALRRIRDRVAEVCRDLDLSDDLTDSVVLAVDELTTNALRYGPCEVRRYDDPLAWGVADRCPAKAYDVDAHLDGELPLAPSPAECGRGLHIVAVLFPEHTVTPTTIDGHPGKEIRITVPR